jgi:hypothetical protein
MSSTEPKFTVQVIQRNWGSEEESEFLINGTMETSAGKSMFSVSLTDEESAEMNNLVERIFQRYRQALKEAL